MLPTVGSDSFKILWYAAEVVGRTLGVAGMPTLVPEAPRRDALTTSGNKMAAAVTTLSNALVARIVYEFVENRIIMGKGRGVDRAFDAFVSASSETIRTSLPDRRVSNPDYRAIFPNGAEEYTSPTIHQDERIAMDMRQAISDSKLAVKNELLASIDAILPLVSPAVAAVVDGEKQVNALFQAEITARKLVVDTLWEERKAVEGTLGRAGRGLARFIFFDYTKGSGDKPEKPPEASDSGAPEAPKEPA